MYSTSKNKGVQNRLLGSSKVQSGSQPPSGVVVTVEEWWVGFQSDLALGHRKIRCSEGEEPGRRDYRAPRERPGNLPAYASFLSWHRSVSLPQAVRGKLWGSPGSSRAVPTSQAS